MNYTKHYTSPTDLLVIMRQRGLDVSDVDEAEEILKSIGYYRMSGYLYPFLQMPKSAHIYKPGSTFAGAVRLYEFDREFRQFVFDKIERIEIAVRSAIVNIVCSKTGDVFWVTSPEYFSNKDKFLKTLLLIDKELQSSREDFILHFSKTYEDRYPPSWMLAEIMPLGVLTRVYENIADNRIRKEIARHFNLSVPVFISWMTIVTLTRNVCCHHGRLWNRKLSLRALTMTKQSRPWISDKIMQGRVFFTLCILKYFIDTIKPQNKFKEELLALLNKFPSVDIAAMGFSGDWQCEQLWIK